MEKCDITVSKSMTIPTDKKYTTIKPSVTITLRDVETRKVNEVYEYLETIVSGLMLKSIKEDEEVMNELTSLGIRKFFRQAGSRVDEGIKEGIKKLIGDNIPF